MSMMRNLLCISFYCVIAAASGALAADPVRIGVSLGASGKYQFPSRMQMRAYQLWENEVNDRGGLLGRKVKMVILDDRGDKQQAIDNYRNLIADDRVDLIIGPYSSGITAAVAPVVEDSGYPMLAAGAAADAIWSHGYENVFVMWTPASRYSVFMLDIALLNDVQKIAIVHADDPFSTNVAKGASKWVSRMEGLEEVYFRDFKKGRRDLKSLASEVKQAGAELVIMGGHFNESVDMSKAFKAIGWYPKAYFATVGPALEKYGETLGNDAECTFATSIWEPSVNFSKSQEFTKAFKESYQEVPSYHAATAYAAGQILEEASKLAGSLEHDELRQALAKLDTFSVIGRYAVDRTGVQIKRFPLLIQWQNGKKEIVWPEDARTAKPRFNCGS